MATLFPHKALLNFVNNISAEILSALSERFETVSEKRRFQVSAAISKVYKVDSQKWCLEVSGTLLTQTRGKLKIR